VLSAIVNRLGEEVLTLTGEDLYLSRDDIKAAIDHQLDICDFFDEGLDAHDSAK
jgi:hypothetical protein